MTVFSGGESVYSPDKEEAHTMEELQLRVLKYVRTEPKRVSLQVIANALRLKLHQTSSILKELMDDMLETLYAAPGVGLAAPQVVVLRRVVVIDCGDGPILMANPVIVDSEGSQPWTEGCLSLPGKQGKTHRPERVRVQYQDPRGQACEVTGEGLLAVCLCHEIDHLDGKLFVDIVEGDLMDVSESAEEEE
jgi:peptide deformylase